MVPQHGLFSLHTMLEGPRLHTTAFPTHMVRPLDEYRGSLLLQGHGSWLVCEVALMSYVCLKWWGFGSSLLWTNNDCPSIS